MAFQAASLQEWLAHLETVHKGGAIDMGLRRTEAVRQALNLKPACPVIVVGGTNGKGSVCAYLTAIYREAGYRVGTLTSPHLLTYNERIALNGTPCTDGQIIEAFEAIEAARGEVSLTYFEFNVLAAVWLFARAQVEVMVLEVGMGGRLDAVNVFDADVAVITSVDLDHMAFLGDNVEAIAFEKAGIMRAGRPVVCGQLPLPQAIAEKAQQLNAPLLLKNRDFAAKRMDNQWSFVFTPQHNIVSGSLNANLNAKKRHALPIPALRGAYQIDNAACALAALECLSDCLPVDIASVKRGLLTVHNPGRFQVLPGRPMVVLDVGHNPHAAHALKKSLALLPFASRRLAVFSMLADKDMQEVTGILKDEFDAWYIAPLADARGATLTQLQQLLREAGAAEVYSFEEIGAACRAALSAAGENDRIVVFGSFHTVGDVLTHGLRL